MTDLRTAIHKSLADHAIEHGGLSPLAVDQLADHLAGELAGYLTIPTLLAAMDGVTADDIAAELSRRTGQRVLLIPPVSEATVRNILRAFDEITLPDVEPTPTSDAIHLALDSVPNIDDKTNRQIAEHVAGYLSRKQIDTLSEVELITALENRSGFEVMLVQRDHNTLAYDPAVEGAVLLRRDFAGIAVIDDNVVRLLADHEVSVANMIAGMSDVTRAVTIARLRAWADALEKGADQ